ncbi:ABC transporter substrate-binding protein [Devriesea agamarum]|uniref:ABC transporter substrate-binding protein n=1 Tax=Devriesea agamarum TaxID=472569 RepID=UPI00071CCF49|nr:ABC transporter substrate-binding protein [Devriesea agamarum]
MKISSRSLTSMIATIATVPLLLSACGTSVSTDKADSKKTEAIERIDNCGQQLVFHKTPTKVVSLMPTQTELLLRMGLRDAIVAQAQTGVSELPADVAQQAKDIPVLSTDAPPSREKLLSVSPDFVVSPTSYEFTAEQGFATVQQLRDNGANVYIATGGCKDRRNTAKVADVFTDIQNIGAIMGVPDEANKLIADGKHRLKAVEDKISGHPRPTVAQLFVEGGSLSAIGAGVEADIVASAGGKNVFSPTDPQFAKFFAAQINPEEVVARNPEVIVFGVTGSEHENQTRDYLKKTFPNVSAVKNDRLVAIPERDLHPGTLGNIGAVEVLAKALYPGVF